MGELIFSQNYRLDKESVKTAVIKKHFSEHLTKTLVQSILFFILGIYFVLNAVLTDDNMSVFLATVCAVGLAAVILNPFFTANSGAKVFSDGVDFTFSLFEEGVKIERGETVTDLEFDSISSVLELEDFIYFEGQNRFFPIPKEALGKENLKQMSNILALKLEDRYKNRVKTTKYLNK